MTLRKATGWVLIAAFLVLLAGAILDLAFMDSIVVSEPASFLVGLGAVLGLVVGSRLVRRG